ncbi:MAG TPA: circadian clock protein KaiC [Smithella sp.]|nr:circadian clock protein KaiC [Smithella sp.]
MKTKSNKLPTAKKINLPKCPTGISGLDDITMGGLPKGRPMLICGNTGCGKTLLSTEFLLRGALQFNEPGVFMSFEETGKELTVNVASLGYDVQALVDARKLIIDHVRVERSEIEETGMYDLEGLFIRLNNAIDSIKAKRVVLDTIEALFSGFGNETILRSELRRLFGWLKKKGVTAIITGEQGEKTLTRYGIEEYVADCVIFLDNRVCDQLSIRRLRIIKYRGSSHGSNEYPFLIDDKGISIMPITSLRLDYDVTAERISTGIPRLDTMLGGRGYFRGSSILVSGTAGTGKTTIANHFADATCRRGKKCLYFAHEESPRQIMRNMRSIGLDLARWEKKGLLKFRAERPTFYGLEMHLVSAYRMINEFNPSVVIVDPISDLTAAGNDSQVKQMLVRLVDFVKSKGITLLCTDLTATDITETTKVGISSLMDTWLLVQNIEQNGERNRGLYILKSRGMEHSNQIREFLLTSKGARLVDVFTGTGMVLTGSSRVAKEAEEAAAVLSRKADIDRKKRDIERKKKTLESQIQVLQSQFESEEEELDNLQRKEMALREANSISRRNIAKSREAD